MLGLRVADSRFVFECVSIDVARILGFSQFASRSAIDPFAFVGGITEPGPTLQAVRKKSARRQKTTVNDQ